jgi:hypothetical protein
MTGLLELIGYERPLREMAQAIRAWAASEGAATVGALHVTCSDESERECAEVLQHEFLQHMLPPLKPGRRAAFQISNLGARYELGAAPLAEDHFLGDASTKGLTLLVGKVNGHVAFEESENGGFRLGVWQRYGRESTGCGALASLLAGKRAPALDDLRETFVGDGQDRLSALRDPARVDPAYRALIAAAVSAHLQAHKAARDLENTPGTQSTAWVILPCVTINQHGTDTEILCGVYEIDGRQASRRTTYTGLGGDPTQLTAARADGRFTIGRKTEP